MPADQNPLIVIDGIVRDMTAFNMLDPNDVENVNVLKDASATAVYGVRGANGVIIVTTSAAAKAAENLVHGQCRLHLPDDPAQPGQFLRLCRAAQRGVRQRRQARRHQGLFAGRTVEIPA